jgi:hypothetical protein
MSDSATVPNTTTAFRPLDSTTVLRPTRLLCPGCKRNGNESVLACLQVAKIEFHHCRGCGGAWFYEKVMDEALRATGEHEWPEPAPTPAVVEKQSPEVKVEHPWACPCCGGNLVGVNDRRGTDPPCTAAWSATAALWNTMTCCSRPKPPPACSRGWVPPSGRSGRARFKKRTAGVLPAYSRRDDCGTQQFSNFSPACNVTI